MNTRISLRVRRSIKDLQDDYAKGDKKPLEDLMRAWKGIKDLPPTDPKSFFALSGLHGEPFRGAGWGSNSYWGGYCNHGNILFPTWHRVYLLKVEEALQSIPGCQDVMLPYWDETSDESLKNGVPWALTQESFVLDGVTIPNPLRSFVLNRNIHDFINGDNPNYGKPKGYETVRYPLSGLVGSPDDLAATEKHNALYPNYDDNVKLLNQNVIDWLTSTIIIDGKTISTSVKTKFINCLDAPNYTVFSNTSSAAQWNTDQDSSAPPVVPLESPHNDIHLAVGGFDTPSRDDSPITGANGDMGEPDTASFDPIFYFHHCFIDRVFWLWQKKNGFTDHLHIIAEYPGTNSVDYQGPTPGVTPNSWLTLDSPLNPFKHEDDEAYVSRQCINIESQLSYTYGPGSLDEYVRPSATAALEEGHSTKTIQVTGLNRAATRGSFLVSVFANIDGKRYRVGTESVFNRWSVQGCANCQTHLEVKAFIGLHSLQEESLKNASYEVEVRTRDGVLNQHRSSTLSTFQKDSFRVEVR